MQSAAAREFVGRVSGGTLLFVTSLAAGDFGFERVEGLGECGDWLDEEGEPVVRCIERCMVNRIDAFGGVVANGDEAGVVK